MDIMAVVVMRKSSTGNSQLFHMLHGAGIFTHLYRVIFGANLFVNSPYMPYVEHWGPWGPGPKNDETMVSFYSYHW